MSHNYSTSDKTKQDLPFVALARGSTFPVGFRIAINFN